MRGRGFSKSILYATLEAEGSGDIERDTGTGRQDSPGECLSESQFHHGDTENTEEKWAKNSDSLDLRLALMPARQINLHRGGGGSRFELRINSYQ